MMIIKSLPPVIIAAYGDLLDLTLAAQSPWAIERHYSRRTVAMYAAELITMYKVSIVC
jgi:hypothetical protein